jgi:hypothetical protein
VDVLYTSGAFQGIQGKVASWWGNVGPAPCSLVFNSSNACKHLLHKFDCISDFSARYFPYDSKTKDPNQQAIPNHHNLKIPSNFT